MDLLVVELKKANKQFDDLSAQLDTLEKKNKQLQQENEKQKQQTQTQNISPKPTPAESSPNASKASQAST